MHRVAYDFDRQDQDLLALWLSSGGSRLLVAPTAGPLGYFPRLLGSPDTEYVTPP